MQVESLGFRDMFLLWAIRLSCAPQLCREDLHPTLDHAFRLAKVGDALRPFLDFTSAVNAVWHHARRSPDIRCTCSQLVGEDEWRLMRLLASLQQRDLTRASACVRDVLPAAGVRLLLDRSLHVAAAFGTAGWHFCVIPPRVAVNDDVVEIRDASEVLGSETHYGVLH